MNETSPHTDDSSTMPQNTTPDAALWDEIKKIRDDLANKMRRHEAGQDIDAQQVLAKTRDAITKGLPITVTPDMPIIDYSSRDLLNSYWQQVTKRRATVSTGFGKLNDALSGGVEAKRLMIVLGAPNTGKTTFVHQMSDSIANSGRPVLYVTSEDGPHELFAKTLARVGNVSYTAVLKGYQSEESKINAALALQMDRMSIDRLRYLDASYGISMDTIREKAQAHFAAFPTEKGGGSGVLVIDYLQRIARAIRARSGTPQDLKDVVSNLTEQLKALASELECGVIAIASQNRASGYSTANSSLSSAKESGDIEYTADVMLALGDDMNRKRTVPYLTPVMLRIDKNRQGKKDLVLPLDFYTDRQQFTEAEV